MDMVTPPVVADLPAEVAAGMVERDGGLLDDDVTVVGNASHDQDPAVIMMAHSTCAVYADFNVQVLGKKSLVAADPCHPLWSPLASGPVPLVRTLTIAAEALMHNVG